VLRLLVAAVVVDLIQVAVVVAVAMDIPQAIR
jgi:hypothetical protein